MYNVQESAMQDRQMDAQQPAGQQARQTWLITQIHVILKWIKLRLHNSFFTSYTGGNNNLEELIRKL